MPGLSLRQEGRIGRETVQYVSNIFKYYIACQLAIEKIEQKKVVLKK